VRPHDAGSSDGDAVRGCFRTEIRQDKRETSAVSSRYVLRFALARGVTNAGDTFLKPPDSRELSRSLNVAEHWNRYREFRHVKHPLAKLRDPQRTLGIRYLFSLQEGQPRVSIR